MHLSTLGPMALPMGGQLALQQLEFGRGSGLLSVVGGLHGDEYNALGCCTYLARFLTQVENRHTPYQLQGRIRLLPAVNVLGLITGERAWPVDNSDLNRLFPGYVAGEVAQRIAHLVYEAVRPSQLCIDLHSGGLLREWPQVRTYSDNTRVMQAAIAAGLPMVWIRAGQQSRALEVTSAHQGTLVGTLQQSGVDSLIFAAGESQRLDRSISEQLAQAILRIALHLGILRGPAKPLTEPVQAVRDVQSCYSSSPGLWYPAVLVGQRVMEQQPLGEVLDPILGEVLETVLSPVSGLVLSIRHHPLITGQALVGRVAKTP